MKTTSERNLFGKVNQRELARELGVSQSLISKILSGKNDASKEMTARILNAAAKKGYRPNLLVRGIQTGQTKTIGVVMPADDFYSGIMHGIHDSLERAGYAMILVWDAEHVATPDSQKELIAIHGLLDRRVDGVILRPTHDDATRMYFSEIHERGIPLVIVDRELAEVASDYVGTDNYSGGMMAARHLLDLGHRHLGHIAGPNRISPAKDRRRGFEDAVADYGDGASCLTIEATNFHSVKTEVLHLLQSTPRPTAVFGANDLVATEIYSTAKSLGLNIPKDISIIGFGNLTFGQFMSPALTTIHQHPYRIGEEAAQLLLARCSEKITGTNSTPIQVKKITPDLVVRESTQIHTNEEIP